MNRSQMNRGTKGLKRGKRMKPRSKKREAYMVGRRERVAEAVGDGHNPCQMRAPGCTGYGTTLHEPATRGRFGGLEAAVKAGGEMLVCALCNQYASEHPQWASERGFLQSATLDGKRHSPKGPVPRPDRGNE